MMTTINHLDLHEQCPEIISPEENKAVEAIKENINNTQEVINEYYCGDVNNLKPIIELFASNPKFFQEHIYMKKTTRGYLIQKALKIMPCDDIIGPQSCEAIKKTFNIDLSNSIAPKKISQTQETSSKKTLTTFHTPNVNTMISSNLKNTVKKYYNTIMEGCDCNISDAYAIALIESNGGNINTKVKHGSGWFGLTTTGVAGAIQYLNKNPSLKYTVSNLHPNLHTLLNITGDANTLISHANTNNTRRTDPTLNTILGLVILRQNTGKKTQTSMFTDALGWAKQFAKAKNMHVKDIENMYHNIKQSPQQYSSALKTYAGYNGSKHKDGYALFVLTTSELLKTQNTLA